MCEYSYLIETTGPFTKEKLKAYKSLEEYNYFCNSYVHTVYHYESGRVFILKAKVTPSQNSADKPHESWVVVCKETGSIRTAHCTCMAGCVLNVPSTFLLWLCTYACCVQIG